MYLHVSSCVFIYSISIYLHVSPCISIYLFVSLYIFMYLHASSCIFIYSISIYLYVSSCTSMCSQASSTRSSWLTTCTMCSPPPSPGPRWPPSGPPLPHTPAPHPLSLSASPRPRRTHPCHKALCVSPPSEFTVRISPRTFILFSRPTVGNTQQHTPRVPCSSDL